MGQLDRALGVLRGDGDTRHPLPGLADLSTLVGVQYAAEPPITSIDDNRSAAYEPEKLFGGLLPARMEFGDVDGALATATTRVYATYRFAANHHNTLEPAATTAAWDGDRLTIYDSTMGVRASQLTVAQLLGLPLSHVRVVSSFVGGAFGVRRWCGRTSPSPR